MTERERERERAQNADFRKKPQFFSDSPPLLEIQAFRGRRKPQKTADFRRKPQIGVRHHRSVTFSSALVSSSEHCRRRGPLSSWTHGLRAKLIVVDFACGKGAEERLVSILAHCSCPGLQGGVSWRVFGKSYLGNLVSLF